MADHTSILVRITNILAVAALALAGVVVPAGTTLAASSATLSGRVYNGDTGQGYGGVKVYLCGDGSATTSANGNWQVSVPAGSDYCGRVTSGAPVGLAGPATRNNPDVGAQSTYEDQVAGTNCYHNAGCSVQQQSWDRSIDNGLDFVYTKTAAAPPPAPVAAPAAVPTTAPAATPAPTTDPAAGTVPENFTAKVGKSATIVELAWKQQGSGVTYHIDESLDNQTWQPLADKLTTNSYSDTAAAPDVHYYFRLQAVGADGTPSGFATADTTTKAVPTDDISGDTSVTSHDNIATVYLAPGFVPADSTCQVTPSDSVTGNGRTVIVGPYQLTCTTTDGTNIDFGQKTVQWHFSLAGKLGGYVDPRAGIYGTNDELISLQAGRFDQHSQVLAVTAPASKQVAVLAATPDRSWINYVVIGGIGLLVAALLLFIPLRGRRKLSYQEYLRAKYYDL